MHGLQWRPLQAVDQDCQRDAGLNAHYAAQWLARAARACIPPQPDHGHTNLGWDDALGGFTTHPLPDGARLGLKIAGLTLAVLDGAGKDQAFVLAGRRDAEVREWLGDLLAARRLDPKALDAPSPYEMPPHPIAGGAAYGTALGEALRALAAWYGNANLLLGNARQRLVDRKIAAPPVRCWPHHFDLDTLIAFGSGEAVRTMGVGFSPGDEYYDEPYFYVGLHPAPEVATLPRLPAIAHWHAHDFTGAVAPASRIVAARDQRAEIEAYLTAATEIGIRVLG
jgi:hypothetical protein